MSQHSKLRVYKDGRTILYRRGLRPESGTQWRSTKEFFADMAMTRDAVLVEYVRLPTLMKMRLDRIDSRVAACHKALAKVNAGAPQATVRCR